MLNESGVNVGNAPPTLLASVDSCEQACHYINHKGRCRRFHYLLSSNHRLMKPNSPANPVRFHRIDFIQTLAFVD